MEDISPLLNFYSHGLSDHLKKLAQPLKDCFGLEDFTYFSTTPNGHAYILGNNAEVKNFYFSNHLFKNFPFFCHPKNYHPNQFIITGEWPDKQAHEAQEMMKDKYGLFNFLLISKKEKDQAHIFSFSSGKRDLPLNSIFANNLTALNSFCDYFLNEWKCHLKKMDLFTIDLGKARGPIYFKSYVPLKLSWKNSQKSDFLRKLGLLKPYMDVEQLTNREFQCLECFLKGKTAHQMAEHFGLSRRTIEQYMENIKLKLGFATKFELFEVMQEYKIHNLLKR